MEPTNPAELSPGRSNLDLGDVERIHGHGHHDSSRLSHRERDSRLYEGTPSSAAMTPPPPEAMLFNLTQQLPFGIIAANQLFDLCATGRQTRAVTRQKPS